jgi:predicted acetyltransferase
VKAEWVCKELAAGTGSHSPEHRIKSPFVSDEYRPALEGDLPILASILSWAFGSFGVDAEPWLRGAGLDNVRVYERGGTPVGCLLFIPMAQFFGGRSVQMVGISGVAVAPEMRGTGVAKALMRSAVEELSGRGVALSALYPTTRRLYRSVGYEPAGTYSELGIPMRDLAGEASSLPVRRLGPDDEAGVRALYRDRAIRRQGHLDRGAYSWRRVLEPREGSARAFVVGEPGAIEGYAIFYEKPTAARLHYDLIVTDLVASTERAYRSLFSLLGQHATLGESVVLLTGPGDPVVQRLPDGHFKGGGVHHWMTRIVDVAAALSARGYRTSDARLEMEVRDDVLRRNAGRWVLAIRDGRGHVERGGGGSLSLDVRGLAPLYTGHASARDLSAQGLLSADETTLAVADAVFEAWAPWMPDFF